jgi:hypothetical protein
MPVIIAVLCSTLGSSVLAGGTIVIDVKTGPSYVQRTSAGRYTLRPRPQMAFWLETIDGRYLATIYVTSKVGKDAWVGAETARRPYVLPVWEYKRNAVAHGDSLLPTSCNEFADATTGATPSQSFTWRSPVPDTLKTGTYIVKAEINNSFDYNDTYKDSLPSGNPLFGEYNGQPSLVWQGPLVIGSGRALSRLERLGTGDLLGRNGVITIGTSGLTTALHIVDAISVTYEPAAPPR